MFQRSRSKAPSDSVTILPRASGKIGVVELYSWTNYQLADILTKQYKRTVRICSSTPKHEEFEPRKLSDAFKKERMNKRSVLCYPLLNNSGGIAVQVTFSSQSMTTALSIENGSLFEGESEFENLLHHTGHFVIAIYSAVHGAPISKEDIYQKFLRSLPASWNQIALIMRNKSDIDEIDIDDFYNNLRVYKDEIKRAFNSTNLLLQNLALVFPCFRTLAVLMKLVLPVEILGALVAQDGPGGYDWSNDFEIEPVNYALMAISSSSSLSSSNNETLEEVFQDFQDTSKSSDDDTNFVNQEPFVVKQGPGVNSSQSPPQINHNCCYECGDSLDDIFCQRCTCKSCGKGAHYGYNCPPQIPIISNPEPCYNQNLNEILQNLQGRKEKRIAEEQAVKDQYWKIPVCYDDDDDEESSIPLKDIISELPLCVAITPDSPKTNSLIMEDEHLNTIPETESDELIKSSVEDLVQILSESEDSFEGECDLPQYDDSSKNHDLTFSNPLFDINEDFTSSDESFSEEDVPNENFKIFSNTLFDLDEEITSTKVDQIEYTSINDSQKIDSILDEFAGELTLLKSILPGIDDDNLDPEGDILFLESFAYYKSISPPSEELLLKSYRVFHSITYPFEECESLNGDDDNSTSRPEFESFHVDYPDSGDSTIDVVEDIPVDVPNILPTHLALQLDFDFISSNDLGSDLNASSPSGDRNKIYDPGICIEVESTKILATLSPVINTLLQFSSENEDKVFNHGVLAYKEKSPPSSSHRGLKAFQLSPESPMLIHGDNTPNLGVRHPHFYPP
ncbi:hypothetical protein Tco_1338547 [Tanacetum coccineum]